MTALTTGARIGRFVVLGIVGRGGMGEVYAAFDPDLDRKVAVKLLRVQNAAGVDPSEGRARMLREAQSIAKLSDPNVVTVYDVGTFEGRVFLAMEFVDGNTLTYWLHSQPRHWREILNCFRAAGRGLAAAHHAGIVHRDFKPDNVMVGHDGAVRVMDFGLARAGVADTEAPAAEPSRVTPVGPTTLAASLVRRSSEVRATIGRSPEIRVASLRVDTLLGHAEGPGARPSAPSSGVTASLHSPDAPAGSAPPPLAADPVVPAPLAGEPMTGTGTSDDVEGPTRDLAQPFSVELPPGMSMPAASRLTETGAMMGTPAYMAPEQFQGKSADARSDQFSFCVALYEALYGQRPFEGRSLDEITRAVLAGSVRDAPRHTKVPSWVRRIVLRGLRVERRLRYPAMEDLLEALGRDPARGRRRWMAIAAMTVLVGGLATSLVRTEKRHRQRCAGAEARLEGIWELPGAGGGLTPRKRAVRTAFMATGKRYAADSFTVAMNALDRYVTAWTDMHREACEATNVRGEQSNDVLDLRMMCLQDRLSEVRALTSVFLRADGEVVSRAVQAAQGIRPIEPCADIAVLKAVVRPPEDPVIQRAVAAVRASLANVKALTGAGKYEEALAAATSAVTAAESTRYAPVIAEANLQLGSVRLLTGVDIAKTEENLERAVFLAEATRHDAVASEASTQLIGVVGYLQARFMEAERWGRFSEAILARMGPGQDVLRSWRMNNMGLVYSRQKRLPEALAASLTARDLKIHALGPVSYDVAISEDNIALCLQDLGRIDEALAHSRVALGMLATTVGTEHPQYARSLSNDAELLLAGKKFFESRSLAQRALAILEREENTNQPGVAQSLSTIGLSWLADQAPSKALLPLERAIVIGDAHPELRPDLFRATFGLAQALSFVHGDSARSLTLAKTASIQAERAQMLREKAAIDVWIGDHQSTPRPLSMR